MFLKTIYYGKIGISGGPEEGGAESEIKILRVRGGGYGYSLDKLRRTTSPAVRHKRVGRDASSVLHIVGGGIGEIGRMCSRDIGKCHDRSIEDINVESIDDLGFVKTPRMVINSTKGMEESDDRRMGLVAGFEESVLRVDANNNVA
jgi:hypothetical protein